MAKLEAELFCIVGIVPSIVSRKVGVESPVLANEPGKASTVYLSS
jgi:hypothetical protein